MTAPSSSYALGVFFLVIVSVLWTACSMVVQHLYNDMSFDSPFLIVYIGTSLFSVFLPSRLSYERWGHKCLARLQRRCRLRRGRIRRLEGGEEGGEVIYKNDRGGYHEGDVDGNCIDERQEEEEEEVAIIPWRNHNGGNGGRGEVAELMPANSNNSPPSRNANKGSRSLEMSDYPDDDRHVESTTDDEDHDDDVAIIDIISRAPPPKLLSHLSHLYMASHLAPLWFFSNYSYALSLRYTSIASSTVLASMGSIFAFGFATCTRYGDERVTRWKVLGVALCFAGGVATAWTDMGASSSSSSESDGGWEDEMHNRSRYLSMRHEYRLVSRRAADIDDDDSSARSLMGDIAGLLSAVGYGAYTVLLRHLCPKEEDRMSMQLLFGYVGLLNMIILFPVAIFLLSPTPSRDHAPPEYGPDDAATADGSTATTTLTWTILLFLVLKGLLDNVISDYLWARAVILTSATVASVGLGLTIPMAFVADSIMGDPDVESHLGDVLGAVCVLFGFVFVNIGGEEGTEGAGGGAYVESMEDDGSFDVASAVDDAENRPGIS